MEGCVYHRLVIDGGKPVVATLIMEVGQRRQLSISFSSQLLSSG